ncbi:MAG: SDR family oxidoreductase [Chitinophagaceae bacterium]
MKILITGANGYIGRRLLSALQEQGHELVCCVRDKLRFEQETPYDNVQVLEVNFLETEKSAAFPADIDVAFFLIHSMKEGASFDDTEKKVASGFLHLLSTTRCQQVIYLSGIVNEKQLSKHLSSRLAVEKMLRAGKIPATVLRAGIIVGSGSSSFEIIRDLVEKLPVMITPKWVETKCQPIAIRNVIEFLTGVLLKPAYYNNDFDIGGPEILTYKEMMLQFALARKLQRTIITVPVMTPKLSSYWLYFVTATSYPLAKNLVNSMKVNVVCRPNNLAKEMGIQLLTYRQAVDMAFQKIEQNEVVSSWKDAFSAFNTNPSIIHNAEVPSFGCFTDVKKRVIETNEEGIFANIWSIGGEKGWYYGNALWKARGFLDKAFGGVGLRRGRTSPASLHSGDTLDFWRVLVADRKTRRLLLYAEMKMPGEAWLEFKFDNQDGKKTLVQTATFRPKGLLGRLYWYSVLPFHYFIFNGMINNLVKAAVVPPPAQLAEKPD